MSKAATEEDLADLVVVSSSFWGRVELVFCLIVAPVAGLALFIEGLRQSHAVTSNLMVGGGSILMVSGMIWLSFHLRGMQDRRIHICQFCGAEFRGRGKTCATCAGPTTDEAGNAMAKEDAYDLAKLFHSWWGKLELLLCVIACPAAGIALMVHAGKGWRSTLDFDAMVFGGLFLAISGFLWLMGHFALIQSRRSHVCYACGAIFTGNRSQCPHCGAVTKK